MNNWLKIQPGPGSAASSLASHWKIALALLLPIIVALLILLSGCASPEITPKTQDGLQPGNGGFGPQWQNFTQEERQKMQVEREKLSISACEGKEEGASCELSFGKDAPPLSGNCMNRNGALSCVPERGMDRGSPDPGPWA